MVRSIIPTIHRTVIRFTIARIGQGDACPGMDRSGCMGRNRNDYLRIPSIARINSTSPSGNRLMPYSVTSIVVAASKPTR